VNPAGRAPFHPFLVSGSSVFCPKAARETGRAEILIIATGSEHAFGWHRTSLPLHIHALRAPILDGTHVTNLKLPRRKFLHLAAGAAALPAVSRIARAQTYPARPVRIVVGFPAGGGVDIVARLIAQSLSERLGQQFIVENRTGASGNIGTEVVVRAPPDGYTLLLVAASNAFNAALYPNLNYKFIRDIAPVASIALVPNVMVINPSLPTKTLPEFIAYAKANPGKINMASAGNGSSNQIFGEMFKTMTGVDLVHVPYRGNYLPDLLGGQVQVVFTPISASLDFIKSGKLRALAVTTATRVDMLPDIPTVGEFVPGYEANAWLGVGVPKNTPAEIIDKLNKEINVGLTDPKVRARLTELGNVPMPMTPADFGKFIAEETEKWGKVIRAANIKPE
jgi:tripartite-type tricarboxylate transporter receptor subunit TctC